MKVFKFGGGVLRTSKDLHRLVTILEQNKDEKLIVVVSAFNKVSAKFEILVNNYFSTKIFNRTVFSEIKNYHFNLVNDIFENLEAQKVIDKLNVLFNETEQLFLKGLSPDYHFEYDRIVSYGELLSSLIIYEFLKSKKINCKYEDIRNVILTDSIYTEAKVDWKTSENIIKEKCVSDDFLLCITQGFIAADKNKNTTTLGREGSDFTASILAYAVNADQVVFWKDVDGVYNADPEKSNDFELLPKLSYKESVEQAFYGAKVLHPKTIKPLQNKKIPITVKSFYNENEQGTNITDISKLSPDLYPNIPIYIVKEDQILISVSTKDFSFITENNLGELFLLLSKYRIKVNLMQSSAISFSVCVTNNAYKIPTLIQELKQNFKLLYNENLSLITIRHYDNEAISKMISGRKVYLEQKSRQTVRFIIK